MIEVIFHMKCVFRFAGICGRGRAGGLRAHPQPRRRLRGAPGHPAEVVAETLKLQLLTEDRMAFNTQHRH